MFTKELQMVDGSHFNSGKTSSCGDVSGKSELKKKKRSEEVCATKIFVINNLYTYIPQLCILADTIYEQSLVDATISTFYIIFPKCFTEMHKSQRSSSYPE